MVSFCKGRVTCHHTTNRQDGILRCKNMRLQQNIQDVREAALASVSAAKSSAHVQSLALFH
jgi:hypothetical protein